MHYTFIHSCLIHYSESRIQKKYFDDNFGPFYRTTQIIITSRNKSRPVETFYSLNKKGDDIKNEFDGVMYKDIFDEACKTSNLNRENI